MSLDTSTSEPVGGGATVIGLFRDSRAAERAIGELKDLDFTDGQIGVLMQDRTQERKFALDTGTKAGEGAAAGAVGGGVVGGLVGLLAGVGALAIPGIGPIIAGGTLASVLTGAGIGAAAGGLIGALVGMGIPEEEARYYERGFREGGILVTVDAGARAGEARQVLLNAAAEFGPSVASERGVDEEARRVDETGRVRDAMAQAEARIDETGDARVREAWRGTERRGRRDSSYAGPERRIATV
jgi:hypothetical protein